MPEHGPSPGPEPLSDKLFDVELARPEPDAPVAPPRPQEGENDMRYRDPSAARRDETSEVLGRDPQTIAAASAALEQARQLSGQHRLQQGLAADAAESAARRPAAERGRALVDKTLGRGAALGLTSPDPSTRRAIAESMARGEAARKNPGAPGAVPGTSVEDARARLKGIIDKRDKAS